MYDDMFLTGEHEAMKQQEPMAVKAAKQLCKSYSDSCGIDADDAWHIYGDEFIKDAQEMLDACGATDLLKALQNFPGFLCGTATGDIWIEDMRAAIAKATNPPSGASH